MCKVHTLLSFDWLVVSRVMPYVVPKVTLGTVLTSLVLRLISSEFDLVNRIRLTNLLEDFIR